MGPSSGEGFPIQPDGGLLSVLGDLLFVGVILVMIYPCMRRTIDRIDGHFFRQFFYILEVLLAVAALCFVLMLLLAQQMRVTYCSFIRPYVGDTPEDKVYAGLLLKILVCALLVFNYFCASGVRQMFGSFLEWCQPAEPVNRGNRIVNARCARPRVIMSREVLTNNSNTNSQTPVTHTQTMTHSDFLPAMSFPTIHSDSFDEESEAPAVQRQRFYRDVGTMVRFPEYQTSICSFNICRGPAPDPSPSSSIFRNPPPPPQNSSFNPLQPTPGTATSFSPTSSAGFSTGFHSAYHSTPKVVKSRHTGLPSVQSSFYDNNSRVQNNFHDNYSRVQNSFYDNNSRVPNSFYDNNSRVQSSFFDNNSRDQSSFFDNNSRVQSSFYYNNPRAQSSFYDNNPRGQTSFQDNNPRGQTSFQDNNPRGQTSFQDNNPRGQTSFQDNNPRGQTSFQDNNPRGQTSFQDNRSRVQDSFQSHRTNAQGSSQNSLELGTVQSSCHLNVTTVSSSSHSGGAQSTSYSEQAQMQCNSHITAKLPSPPKRSRPPARRHHKLPLMPKMTRSGKIYGYG